MSESWKKPKKKKARRITLITLGMTLVALYIIFYAPVKVDLVLVAQFDLPIFDRRPIWWAHIRDNYGGWDKWHPFDESVIEYCRNYDFSQGDLIVSWGRPLESLTYKRIDLDTSPSIIGIATFKKVDTSKTVYMYRVKSPRGKRFANFMYERVE